LALFIDMNYMAITSMTMFTMVILIPIVYGNLTHTIYFPTNIAANLSITKQGIGNHNGL